MAGLGAAFVALALALVEAGAVVGVTEEAPGAALVVVVSNVSGFFLDPPVVTAMMAIIDTTAAVTQGHICL